MSLQKKKKKADRSSLIFNIVFGRISVHEIILKVVFFKVRHNFIRMAGEGEGDKTFLLHDTSHF